MKAADLDNSGQIDYTEFIAATLDAQVYMKYENLRSAFDVFDRDGSGKIDAQEIVSILGTCEQEDEIIKINLPDIEIIQ